MVAGTGVVDGPSQDFTATSNFLNTVTVQSLDTFDANGDPVTGASIIGEGGTEYPGSPVPEPGALLLPAAAGLALRRTRKRT